VNAVDAGICGIKTNADKDPKQITGDQNGESEMLRLEAKRDDQEQPANSGSGGRHARIRRTRQKRVSPIMISDSPIRFAMRTGS
jgi:hypothetical protein